jgi:hypothetical protein
MGWALGVNLLGRLDRLGEIAAIGLHINPQVTLLEPKFMFGFQILILPRSTIAQVFPVNQCTKAINPADL